MVIRDDESFLELGHLSINHKGEELCGDHVKIVSGEDSSLTAVLADGLGSGVEASILSTLTSTMLCQMIEGGVGIEEGVLSLAKTLPASKDRGNVAYSTFTLIKVEPDYSGVIYNFDNPEPIFLKNGTPSPLGFQTLLIGGKKIYRARFYLDIGDALILYSDGVIHAGIGETLNFGWEQSQIAAFLENNDSPLLSSKSLATLLLDKTSALYNGRPGDDCTALVLKRRNKMVTNLLVGPPSRKEEDEEILSSFLSSPGKHVVCGGTTCRLVATHLRTKVQGRLDSEDPEVPPFSYIEGIDLATEGIITLNKVLRYVGDYVKSNQSYFTWSYQEDGASLLAKTLLEESSDIYFYSGCAVNPAHQDDGSPITFKMKMQIIDRLAQSLRDLGKNVEVHYY